MTYAPNFQLVDTYNRRLNYLRISVTDRCNLRCIYCVPREDIPRFAHDEILTYEEIIRIVRVGIRLGITKVRVTGGEPLIRKGILEFLKELRNFEALTDISITTNGVLLAESLERIRDIGIRRLNISLDTLDRLTFKSITGYDALDKVWEGIQLARKMEFHPIKINVVAIRGVNENEIADIAKLTLTNTFHVRFIEHMPIGKNMDNTDRPLLADEIIEKIRPLGKLIPITHEMHDGPAERYRIEGAIGEIGLIRPLSHHFCHTCNRLRLTAIGDLKPCLLSDDATNLKTLIRNGCSDDELSQAFQKTIWLKPKHHHLLDSQKPIAMRMSQIGG